MRGRQRLADLDGDRERLVNRQRGLSRTAAGEPLFEGFAVEELHHEVRGALVIANVMECADIGMRQLRDRARFAIEAFAELRIGGEHGWEHLDRDGAIQAGVACLVDLAHPAGAQRRFNLVGTEAGACNQGQGTCGLYPRSALSPQP